MRLWHPSVLQELPSCTLSTLHMSLCRVRQKPWGRPTPRTWYYNLSWEGLCWYHSQVIHEMNQRAWHTDQRWLDYSYRGKSEPVEGEWDMAANRLEELDRINPETIPAQRAALRRRPKAAIIAHGTDDDTLQ